MTGGPIETTGDDLPSEAVKRAAALTTLRDGPLTRAELVTALGVSRTTVHRTVQSLDARGLLVHPDGKLALSVLGATVADEAATYRRRINAANHLQPFLDTIDELPAGLDVGLFADARVTEMSQTNPYAPIGRFMALLRDSDSLSGFDTTTVAPIFVEEIGDQILGGMETDIIYLPAVVDELTTAYPGATAAAMNSGQLTLWTHDGLPFGLAIFDDCIGLGGYDPDSGVLRAFVDTDDPDARRWALDLFESYRETADRVELPLLEAT